MAKMSGLKLNFLGESKFETNHPSLGLFIDHKKMITWL